MLVLSLFRYEDNIDVDPWWKIYQAVEDLNKKISKTIAYFLWKIIYEYI